MDFDCRRVGAPITVLFNIQMQPQNCFGKLLLSHLLLKHVILSSSSYLLRGNTKEHYYFCTVKIYGQIVNVVPNLLHLFSPPPLPDMSSILLHRAVCPGGRPLCLAFWILLVFGQWEAPTAHGRVEGKRDGGIDFPGPLSAKNLLAAATFFCLSTQLLLAPFSFSYSSPRILVITPIPMGPCGS